MGTKEAVERTIRVTAPSYFDMPDDIGAQRTNLSWWVPHNQWTEVLHFFWARRQFDSVEYLIYTNWKLFPDIYEKLASDEWE